MSVCTELSKLADHIQINGDGDKFLATLLRTSLRNFLPFRVMEGLPYEAFSDLLVNANIGHLKEDVVSTCWVRLHQKRKRKRRGHEQELIKDYVDKAIDEQSSHPRYSIIPDQNQDSDNFLATFVLKYLKLSGELVPVFYCFIS